jgi:pyrroloquinoline quinone biosynthesis protein B
VPSTHACLAVSGGGKRWWLVNATPDVHHQIHATSVLHPGPGVRESPLAGVVLTDAEFDHTIGLLMLREGAELDVWGTTSVLDTLEREFPVRRLLDRYARLTWRALTPGLGVTLDEGLHLTAIDLGDRLPRYSEKARAAGAVVAYLFENPASGRRALWAPQVGGWSDSLLAALERADVAFVDGTFWSADELVRTGTGALDASDMGHLPVGGTGGVAQRLAAVAASAYLVHVNNTNPVLDPASSERRQLDELGVAVPDAGLTLEL